MLRSTLRRQLQLSAFRCVELRKKWIISGGQDFTSVHNTNLYLQLLLFKTLAL